MKPAGLLHTLFQFDRAKSQLLHFLSDHKG